MGFTAMSDKEDDICDIKADLPQSLHFDDTISHVGCATAAYAIAKFHGKLQIDLCKEKPLNRLQEAMRVFKTSYTLILSIVTSNR
jgi:hypothetical protein